MIKFENLEVSGWEAAIRGMRNPMNSWAKSDSGMTCPHGEYNMGVELCKECIKNNCSDTPYMVIGNNDLTLMKQLANSGSDHAKFRRMINVTVDITAPLYWWKEYDTYKVGTVANSCSTMHKIQEREFSMDDFSHEHLSRKAKDCLEKTVQMLNMARYGFNEYNEKEYWWDMIQLLPSSFNQKRTVQLNYEVLSGIYPSRKNHKLDEWKTLCMWIETLPYASDIIIKKMGVSDNERES